MDGYVCVGECAVFMFGEYLGGCLCLGECFCEYLYLSDCLSLGKFLCLGG